MKRASVFPHLLHLVLFGGAIAATTSMSLLSPPLSDAVYASFENSPKAVLDEAWQIVNREYVDPSFNQVDWQLVRQELLSRNYSSQREAYNALRESLERLNDPYTRFMDPRQYEQLTSQTSGELSGVGIRLRADEQTGILSVVEPIPNSPAASAGIRTGDRILSIDGKSTRGMSVESASNLIRGQAGTRITLRIERDGETPFNLSLTRARIELPAVQQSVRTENGTRIGYIRLSEFSAHASEQMGKAIRDLTEDNVQGFVLDLRGNPGGLLQASIDISRQWIGTGPIVRTVDRDGGSEETAANHTALTDLPLVVLVDGNSASSSEILTGALMDNGRATIVGSQTFGKALVQAVHGLSDGSGIAVTIAHYYTPSGTDISQRGITPNIRIDLTDAQRQRLVATPALLATASDPQYAEAVSALRNQIASRTRPDVRASQRISSTETQPNRVAQPR